MGPRPLGRGNLTQAGTSQIRTSSFNGATSSRTWKRLNRNIRNDPRVWLQWGHVLSDVETGGSATTMCPGSGASMGPRPLGRGNSNKTHCFKQRPGRFNGATSSRTWKPVQLHAINHTSLGFNGATSSRTWKLPVPLQPNPLQPNWICICFNGATSSRTWKPAQAGIVHTLQIAASMGPRPLGRGNLHVAVACAHPCQASMGPRPLGRGNRCSRRAQGCRYLASMGPRPLGRGNMKDSVHYP